MQGMVDNAMRRKMLHLGQYLRQKLRRFCMNPADFCGLENTVLD